MARGPAHLRLAHTVSWRQPLAGDPTPNGLSPGTSTTLDLVRSPEDSAGMMEGDGPNSRDRLAPTSTPHAPSLGNARVYPSPYPPLAIVSVRVRDRRDGRGPLSSFRWRLVGAQIASRWGMQVTNRRARPAGPRPPGPRSRVRSRPCSPAPSPHPPLKMAPCVGSRLRLSTVPVICTALTGQPPSR